MIFAFTTSYKLEGPMRVPKAVAISRWDPAADSGAGAWVLIDRLSEAQADGRVFGAAWMATGPWVPGERSSSTVLTDFFVMWTDYRAQSKGAGDDKSALGGRLCMIRATRASASDPWKTGPAGGSGDPNNPNIVLYEEEVPSNSIDMHFHTGSVVFPDASNPYFTRVILSIGDTAKNNRLVVFERDDYRNYADGWTSSDPHAALAPNPKNASGKTEATFPPVVPVTGNGWTTFEDRQGQRARLFFHSLYLNTGSSPRLFSPTEFAPLEHPSGTYTPVVITSPITGGQVYNAVSSVSVDGHGRISLFLTHAYFASEVPPNSAANGYMLADDSIQCMAQLPLSQRDHVLLCGDEQSDYFTAATVDGGSGASRRISLTRVAGVPTDVAREFVYDSSFATVYLPQDSTKNWLIFLATCAKPWQGADYAALRLAGSISGWSSLVEPSSILYSQEGAWWGQMFAPGSTLQTPSAFMGTRYFVGSISPSLPLYSIPTPTVSLNKALAISPGGTNKLRYYQSGGTNAVELASEGVIPSGWVNSVAPVASPSPAPPSAGPVMRVKLIDGNYAGVWRLAEGLSQPYIAAKVRLFIRPTPPGTGSGTNANTLPTATVGGSIRVTFGWRREGTSHPVSYYANPSARSRSIDIRAIAGEGWTPVVLQTSTAEWGSLPNAADGNWELCMEITGAPRQDFMVCVDAVVIGEAATNAAVVDLPSRPLQYSSTGASSPEYYDMHWTPGGSPSSSWNLQAGMVLPITAPDTFTRSRASIADLPKITVLTIYESSSRFIRVVFNRQDPQRYSFGTTPALSTIQFYDSSGTMFLELTAPTLPESNNVKQPFCFLRETQVLLAFSQEQVDADTIVHKAWASVGGTIVAAATSVTSSSTSNRNVRPSRVNTGDHDGVNQDSIAICGMLLDDANALTDSAAKAALESLSFLA